MRYVLSRTRPAQIFRNSCFSAAYRLILIPSSKSMNIMAVTNTASQSKNFDNGMNSRNKLTNKSEKGNYNKNKNSPFHLPLNFIK